MITEIIMPQGGQDLESGKVVKWLKEEGESVRKGEVVCEVETEKAAFEVQSPGDGYLRKILVPAGNETPILSVIGVIGELNDPLDQYLEKTSIKSSTAAKESVTMDYVRGISRQSTQQVGRIRISPKAKKIALLKGVPLERLRGTGPLGRIVTEDVLKAIEQNTEKKIEPEEMKNTGEKVINLTRVRKMTAQRMIQSKQNIPHFYVTLSVDMTRALEFRQQLNQQNNLTKEESISINDLIIKACGLALKEYPEINASYLDEEHIVLHEDSNIGIAVSLENGLVAPVVEKVDQSPILELSRRIRQLIDAARTGKQLSTVPGRFTVSNLGMYNIENFSAIINPPEAAILAVSTIRKLVEVDENNEIIVRDKVNLTLSIDHRVCDGVQACKFINRIKDLLESPELMQ